MLVSKQFSCYGYYQFRYELYVTNEFCVRVGIGDPSLVQRSDAGTNLILILLLSGVNIIVINIRQLK